MSSSAVVAQQQSQPPLPSFAHTQPCILVQVWQAAAAIAAQLTAGGKGGKGFAGGGGRKLAVDVPVQASSYCVALLLWCS